MKKWVVSAVLVALLNASTDTLGESPAPCSMTAAIFLPLSGAAATLGEDFRLAAELSYKRLPEEARQRLKIVYEDTQMNAAVAISAHRSLVSRVQPDVMLVAFSESVHALAPLAEKAETPLIGCAPTREYLTGRRFVFRHWVDAELMSPVLLGELQRQGRKRLGLVYSEHPAQEEFARYFQSYAKERGIEFVMVSSVLPNETDFRGIAAQIARKQPDGVVYFLLPPQPSPFAKQYRVLDRTTPMFAFINTESENEVRAAQGALEGVVYVGPQFTEAFVQDFSKQFGDNYPEICSGNFYDMVQMLGQAVLQNRCSGDSLRGFVAGLTSFTGAGGTYGISPQREFRMPVELRTVRNGKFAKYR